MKILTRRNCTILAIAAIALFLIVFAWFSNGCTAAVDDATTTAAVTETATETEAVTPTESATESTTPDGQPEPGDQDFQGDRPSSDNMTMPDFSDNMTFPGGDRDGMMGGGMMGMFDMTALAEAIGVDEAELEEAYQEAMAELMENVTAPAEGEEPDEMTMPSFDQESLIEKLAELLGIDAETIQEAFEELQATMPEMQDMPEGASQMP